MWAARPTLREIRNFVNYAHHKPRRMGPPFVSLWPSNSVRQFVVWGSSSLGLSCVRVSGESTEHSHRVGTLKPWVVGFQGARSFSFSPSLPFPCTARLTTTAATATTAATTTTTTATAMTTTTTTTTYHCHHHHDGDDDDCKQPYLYTHSLPVGVHQ